MFTRFTGIVVAIFLFVCNTNAMFTRGQNAACSGCAGQFVQLGDNQKVFAQSHNLFEPAVPQVVDFSHLSAAPQLPRLFSHRSYSADSADSTDSADSAESVDFSHDKMISLTPLSSETPQALPQLKRWNSLFGPDPNAPQPPPAFSPFAITGSPMALHHMPVSRASSPFNWQLPNTFPGASPTASPFAQIPMGQPMGQPMSQPMGQHGFNPFASSPFAQIPMGQPGFNPFASSPIAQIPVGQLVW